MKIEIRTARLEDADRLADLSTQLGYPSTSDEVIRRLAEILSRPEHAVLVAQMEAGVVGWVHVFASLTVESERCAEIGGLVVEKSQRGQGVGRALLESAEAWAREHSLSEVRLRSNVVRTEAHEFYKGFGYENIKTQLTFRRKL